MLKQINYDFYNITGRIKEIYSNYIIFFSYVTKEYCVYSKNSIGKINFEFSVGTKLDNRALKKAIESSVKNYSRIFKQIEEINLKIEKKNFDNMMDYSKDQLNVYLSYANKKIVMLILIKLISLSGFNFKIKG